MWCLVLLASLAWLGCSGATPGPQQPAPVAAAARSAGPRGDAGVRAAPVPVPPDALDPLATAPAWVFRYQTKARAETWTLRFADGRAQIVVESTAGTVRYTGTATQGPTLAIAVATPTARLALDCKRTRRAIGARCNDRKAKPIEVLDCYHPDFATPMPFAPAPGVAYVVDADCNGYRLVPGPAGS